MKVDRIHGLGPSSADDKTVIVTRGELDPASAAESSIIMLMEAPAAAIWTADACPAGAARLQVGGTRLRPFSRRALYRPARCGPRVDQAICPSHVPRLRARRTAKPIARDSRTKRRRLPLSPLGTNKRVSSNIPPGDGAHPPLTLPAIPHNAGTEFS